MGAQAREGVAVPLTHNVVHSSVRDTVYSGHGAREDRVEGAGGIFRGGDYSHVDQHCYFYGHAPSYCPLWGIRTTLLNALEAVSVSLVVRTQEHVLHRFACSVVAATTVCLTAEAAVHQPRAPINDITRWGGVHARRLVHRATVHGTARGTDGTGDAFDGHIRLVGLTRRRQWVAVMADL